MRLFCFSSFLICETGVGLSIPLKSNPSFSLEGYFKVLCGSFAKGNKADFKAQQRQLSSSFFTFIIAFFSQGNKEVEYKTPL